MEDPNRTYCHHCEGYTNTYHLMMGQPMCTMCGNRKSPILSPTPARDWSPHREEPCDSIGVDDELRNYEEDILDDGFGNRWSVICPDCGQATMQIVRPGKVQCSECLR